ncbi:MAG: phage Mu F virion morphogenesis protein [Candidatus Peregrinibacteria bacterium GW2011_GWC2_33_13]|nr:MAG: phage Mu F virion morphogenesis protein [Candidatus Peregrinibacteria bacterium GW2011_GWC2_33_13]
MPKTPDLKYLISLKPEQAIKYLKNKGFKFSWDWHEVWQDAHTRSFTVAKVMREDILNDIREIVQKSLDEGLTLQQFKKELVPKLKDKGWWGIISGTSEEVRDELIKRKLIKDKNLIPESDEPVTVQLGTPWRLKTIYRTNIQTSYMAGRYKEQINNTDNRSCWQYVAVMDRRTRPSHAQLNGKVFRYDDPFWDSFYPPNGWGCRCRVRALSDDNLKDRNFDVDSSEGQISEEMRVISKKTGEEKPVAVYTDSLTGHKVSPDVGWSYNPGNLKNWRQQNDN